MPLTPLRRIAELLKLWPIREDARKSSLQTQALVEIKLSLELSTDRLLSKPVGISEQHPELHDDKKI
jgi:hypothetical protein